MTPATSDSPAPGSESATLAGKRILITRPAAQAEALRRLLQARGATVVQLPLLTIEPARQPALAARALQTSRDFDCWIFTSTNAVKFATQLDGGVWPAALVAIGAATATALQALGREALAPAGGYSSEGVLSLPLFAEPAGKRVLVVTGAGGLDLIAPELARRGVSVERAEVYRRVPLPHAPERVLAALRGTQAIVLTSLEALDQLLRLTPEASQAALKRKQLVVPSQRVVEKALELGFSAPLVPDQVADAAFVRCLEQWAHSA